MKKIYLIIILSILSIHVSANNLIEQADSAYTNDDFANAVELYNQAIIENGSSSMLYYNLGNSYYRLGQLGNAIVAYERAIILDPRNDDALTNLEFVNTKITDKKGDNGTFISNTFNTIIGYYHSNTWAIFAVIAFVAFLVAIALYVFSSVVSLKKAGFFGGFVLLIIMIVAIIFSSIAANNVTKRNKAVIIDPSTILSTSPRTPKDRSEEAMLLHEGTKVEILDSITEPGGLKWYDVKVDNTHRAWIKSTAIEII